MNKILLIGGNCPLGRSIIASAPCAIDAPTSAEFDLSDTKQIAEFDFSEYDTLIINARAGGGQRYPFGEWPTELLSYNLDVNIRGITLLLQRWLNHTDSGTVVFTGSDGIRHRGARGIPYWASKGMIISMIDALRDVYPSTDFFTYNPPSFPNKRGEDLASKIIQDEEERDPDAIAQWIWFGVEHQIAHMDIRGKKILPNN